MTGCHVHDRDACGGVTDRLGSRLDELTRWRSADGGDTGRAPRRGARPAHARSAVGARALGLRDRRSRSDRGARAPSGVAHSRARHRAVRSDGGVAVRVLPRRRGDHGAGPRHHADDRHPRAAHGRRPRRQLREVRQPRAKSRLRHQRLRRDGSRPLGVGCQAAVREPPRRVSPARVLTQRLRPSRDDGRALVPRALGRLLHLACARPLVRAHRDQGRSRSLPDEIPSRASTATPRRHGARISCARSRSSPKLSMGSTGSSTTRRCSCT